MVKLLWVDQNSKPLLFFLHVLITISFSPRWWSVLSAVTTTGWWWRRWSRSSSSTSSPSSITTPGTLSTLSHVGRLIEYHIKRCQSLPLFIDSKKITFLSNLRLCTWSKFAQAETRCTYSAVCFQGEFANFLLLGVQIYFTDLFLDKKFAWWDRKSTLLMITHKR